jgi:hypothetical protein
LEKRRIGAALAEGGDAVNRVYKTRFDEQVMRTEFRAPLWRGGLREEERQSAPHAPEFQFIVLSQWLRRILK